jgi:hypothetical protein
MLRPACWLERHTSPCRRLAPPTRPPAYGRACPGRGLPQPGSAMNARPNHPLPRQDLHLQVCHSLKAAHRNLLFARLPVLSATRVRINQRFVSSKRGILWYCRSDCTRSRLKELPEPVVYPSRLSTDSAAYSCLAVMPDGSLGTLYESGPDSPYKTVLFSSFTVDWLKEGQSQ